MNPKTPSRNPLHPAILLVFVAVMVIPAASSAATIHVNWTNQSGIEDGSQASPYRSIQIGINAASSQNDVVLVAPGTYFERILMQDGVDLVCAERPNCVIDASGRNHSAVVFENTKLYPVLDGFTITGGTGDWSGVTTDLVPIYIGGGIRLQGAGIVINNVIEGNILSDGYCEGGGIIVIPQSFKPQIVGNVIRNNEALCPARLSDSKGGGIHVSSKKTDVIITDNVIESNRAFIGGGIYSRNIADGARTILRNLFQYNEATQGAAVFTEDFGVNSNTTIANNFFFGNGSAEGTIDCDDLDPTAGPGLPELCNDGVDNDCDPATPDIFDADADGVSCDTDCDDTEPAIGPAAAEHCTDTVDNDCDGLTDSEDPDCGCPDNDGDGIACADCDDGNPAVYPGSPEICNDTFDNDCDPATPDVTDLDGDGFNCAIDCDETNAAVNPDATEIDCDELDNDCNPGTPDVVDRDNDKWDCFDDCDDFVFLVNPDGLERCDDGIDNNCDGFIDTMDLECSCPTPGDIDGDGYRCSDCNDFDDAVNPGVNEQCNDGINNDCLASTPDIFDGDGDGTLCDTDCRDFDPSAHPGALEVCNDGIDNDCDGSIDGVDDECICADADEDGYSCSDCDDGDPTAYPGAPEICNDSVDNDCNPATLDVSDGDGDGFLCTVDCDDANAGVSPNAAEECSDRIDNDCDSLVDTLDPDVTLVQFGSPILYLANYADPGIGLAWTQRTFDDNSWINGLYGVGYDTAGSGGAGDLIVTDVAKFAASVYARTEFVIADVSAVNQLDLGCDYDDAYVAWINGVEVYRSPEMPPTGDPAWNTDPALHESSNGEVPDYGTLIDISSVGIPALVEGTNILAVGVYNDGAGTSSDLVVVPRLAMSYGADDPDCLCPDDDLDGYRCDDCDDTDSAINPGAIEVGCNGIDDDCDASTVDDEVDADGDGFDCTEDCFDDVATANPNGQEVGCNGIDDDCNPSTTDLVDADADGVSCLLDCDEQNPFVSPDAAEIACDGIDNDCSTLTPDVFDTDLDGSNCLDDCDDANPAIHPGAAEKCDDGVDNDCNDLIDAADTTACSCADGDTDGYACTDCDDIDPTINPGVTEVCNDTVDNDCNAATLDVDDIDGDGFDCITDCDDANPFVKPGATEFCDDNIDNDCDGATPDIFDADGDGHTCDVDCRDDIPAINPSASELCADSIDNDCNPATPDTFDLDGDMYACDLDCDDFVAAINPNAVEVCDDGVDNDCNAATVDHFDADGDGSTCEIDCNDMNPLVFPGGSEKCDDVVDNDCDTLADLDDPDCASGDGDGDGYPTGVDCNDGDATINPGAPELCNDGIDNDCNPATGDFDDLDGDGYDCDVDCDETDPAINPGALEICLDEIDNDCDPGTIDFGDLDGDLWLCNLDCDDLDANVNPDMPEITCDSIDNDCDVFTLDLADHDGDGVGCTDLEVRGGAIHSSVNSDGILTIVNNTFVQNAMPLGSGGAIWLDDLDGTLPNVVANNILVANTALVGAGMDHTLYHGEIRNNNFFDNTDDDLYNGAQSGATISDNLYMDPVFSSPGTGNYRLDEESPLIDAAVSPAGTIGDVEGFPRPYDGDGDSLAVADLGAYEYPSGEVFDVLFLDGDSLSWPVRPGETDYNVYRGDMARLRISGIYTQNPLFALVDRFCGIPANTIPFTDVFQPPLPGDLVYYLVTLTNGRKSFEGVLGVHSNGQVRPNDAFCP